MEINKNDIKCKGQYCQVAYSQSYVQIKKLSDKLQIKWVWDSPKY